MTIRHLPLPFLCLALAACGSEDAAGTAAPVRAPAATAAPEATTASLVPALSKPEPDAPMAIDSLVPEGSVAWIRVESFDGLCELMDELMHASGSAAGGMDFEAALQLLPVKDLIAHVDRSRSLGLAFGFPEEGAPGTAEPGVTVMLPVSDRGAAIQALRAMPDGPQCFGIDEYVVATNLDEYRPGLGSVQLTSGLLAGRISGRVDARALIGRFGPLLEGQLEHLGSAAGLTELQESMVGALRQATRSAESLDFALGLASGELDLSLALVAKPGSELDGLWPAGIQSLHDLAHCLEDGDTLSMLLAVDSSTFATRVMPLYTRLLDGAVAEGTLASQAQSAILRWGELWPKFGDALAGSVTTAGGAFAATYYFAPEDAADFLASLDALLLSLPGSLPAVRVEGPERGAAATTYRVHFGEELAGGAAGFDELLRLFPSGALTLRVAERRGIHAITIGDDEAAVVAALERIARPDDQVPSGVAFALERIGDANPACVARIDLAAIARDLGPVLSPERAAALPQLGSGPLFVTYYGGVDGRVWHLGFRADVARFGEMFQR